MDSSEGKKFIRKKNLQASSNVLSVLTFSWTFPLFWKGYKRDLTEDDLTDPLKEHCSSYLGNKIERLWDKEVERSKKKKQEPNLLFVILQIFGWHLILNGIVIGFLELVVRVGQPILLGRLLRYFSQPDGNIMVTKEEAYMCAAGIIACSSLPIIIGHPNMMSIAHIGMKVRVAACSLIYRKALKLNKTALAQTTIGQLVNLLSNDVNRFDSCFTSVHMLWVGPLQTCVLMYLMWDLMGPATLIGVASLLLFLPLQGWLGTKISKLRSEIAKRTDERVRLMNEIISGIQVIKMYTWEKPFAALVNATRRVEIKEVIKSAHIKGILISFILFHARTAIFFTILSYVLLGYSITAEKVFVVTSCYTTLKQSMTVYFPQGVIQISECLITVRRIKDFLMINDKTPFDYRKLNMSTKLDSENNTLTFNDDKHFKHDHCHNGLPGIIIKNAVAKWLPNSLENTLSNISVNVTQGHLTAVIGPVGAGKTSLLHAILNELPLTSGSINIHGRLSYASQEAWLFQGSVRQNILFGQSYNRERYRKVVRVCSLMADFELFPYGDRTIVGERGVSLSGGQRARINLARTVYKEADIYLLDDPLSAVDIHVAKHLFEECIQGYLKNKAVILITHQLQFIDVVDQILLLENGAMSFIGSYQALKNRSLDFTKLMLNEEPHEEKNERPFFQRLASRQSSIQSTVSSFLDETINKLPQEVSETKSQGSVSGKVYKSYLSSGGGYCRAICVLFMCFLAQVMASSGDYWLAYWVNIEEYYSGKNASFKSNLGQVDSSFIITETNSSAPYSIILSRKVCIYTFCVITMSTVFIALSRSYLFFKTCMKASMNLHNKMFLSLTHATMWFFNNNSSGRILNRFSKDMGAIDEMLPVSLLDILQIGFTLTGIIIVVSSVNPLLFLPTFIVGVIFFFLRKVYLSTSQSLNRLEAVTRSPVFGHLSASIHGLTTIRAFKAENLLIKEFDYHQDLHSSAWFLIISTSRTFGYWLDVICLVYIALVTLSFLVIDGENLGGNVGLAISQAMGLTGMFRWGMKQTAEFVNQMTSVERVTEYSQLESEHPLESAPGCQPRGSWPEHGKLIFSDVYFRHSAADPWVLKNLNFTILPTQKVGIVGRTGAGKSSLISALFRLADVEGAIFIDGVNTSSIGLCDLRSKISIIPQDPVLFSGSLRKNLDPFDEYNDSTLWNALDEVELKEVVKELTGGLLGYISEGGSNLSVGQRQLVCLARAIVKNNKILVLDEATANVDPQTDSLIQETIRKKFANCTVLTIAHRLNTVMDSDKILVMNAGTMVEFDHPHILLQSKSGFLTSMVEQTGAATEEVLRRVACESYEKNRSKGDMSSQKLK